VIDLCLHVVRKDYGAEIANHIGRRLVVAPHRDGGQAQFIERPIARRENSLLACVLETMSRRLAQDFSVPELARRAAMSERTFLRRFKEATGCTPADWLRFARLDRARQLLESSSFSIEAIAHQCGFRTATTLREQFRKRLGVSPSAYKRRFARPGAGQLTQSRSPALRSGSY
jgi:AraC family transcriptional activator FtrA